MKPNFRELQLYKLLNQLNIKYKTVYHPHFISFQKYKNVIKLIKGTVCINLLLKDKYNNIYLLIDSYYKNKIDTKLVGKSVGIKNMTLCDSNMLQSLLHVDKNSATLFSILYPECRNIKILINKKISKNVDINFHPLRNCATTTISYYDMIKFINHFGNDIVYY